MDENITNVTENTENTEPEVELLVPKDETETEEPLDKKALLLVGAVGAGLTGLTISAIRKRRNARKVAKGSDDMPEEPKAKIKARRDRKLSLLERLTGYTYAPVEEDVDDIPEDEE